MRTLSQCMEDDDISAFQLSEMTGIPIRTIKTYKSQKVLPSVINAIKIARAFQVSVDDIFWNERQSKEKIQINEKSFLRGKFELGDILDPKNLNIVMMSKNIGISPSCMYDYIWKNSVPNVLNAIKICKFIGRKVEDIRW